MTDAIRSTTMPIDRISEQPHILYRFFDSVGALLYVGITIDPRIRWHQHAKEKPDWRQVKTIAVEHFDSRDSALEAEEQAIKKELPAWNVQHKLREFAAQGKPRGKRATTPLGVSVEELETRVRAGKWVTPGAVSILLDIGRTKTHTLLAEKKIRFRRVAGGTQRLCNPEDVLRLLEKSREMEDE